MPVTNDIFDTELREIEFFGERLAGETLCLGVETLVKVFGDVFSSVDAGFVFGNAIGFHAVLAVVTGSVGGLGDTMDRADLKIRENMRISSRTISWGAGFHVK